MSTNNNLFDEKEVEEILTIIEPMINYALLQTKMKYREELKQHLYELSLKSLLKVDFHEPKSLFIDQ